MVSIFELALEIASNILDDPESTPAPMTFTEDYNGGHISIHRRENLNGLTYTATVTREEPVNLTRFETAVDALSAARNLLDGRLELIPWNTMRRAGLLK